METVSQTARALVTEPKARRKYVPAEFVHRHGTTRYCCGFGIAGATTAHAHLHSRAGEEIPANPGTRLRRGGAVRTTAPLPTHFLTTLDHVMVELRGAAPKTYNFNSIGFGNELSGVTNRAPIDRHGILHDHRCSLLHRQHRVSGDQGIDNRSRGSHERKSRLSQWIENLGEPSARRTLGEQHRIPTRSPPA